MTLIDPDSGQEVHVGLMKLPQSCGVCGEELKGEWGLAVPDGRGWTHLKHHQLRLTALPPTTARLQLESVRRHLRDVLPGDKITATTAMLSAVGA